MAMIYAAQEAVIVALRYIGEVDIADRLERCMTARRERHNGDGWPFTCRSPAYVRCRRPMIRGWWNGICQWTGEATARSLAVIPLHLSAGLPDAVRRLRRGLRDVRDRMARRSRRWREVCCSGMAGGDGKALVLVSHDGVDRCEVLCRRWPNAMMKSLEDEEPTMLMTAEDAADLGRHRRATEPLRIVLMPQHYRQATTSPIEAMPVLV
jgi:hypothetical protein